MVATSPSASPSSWRPTSRALGALFAGSAAMFAASVVQGGLAPQDEGAPAAEPAARSAITPDPVTAPVREARTAPPARLAPGQAAPWTPGASPDWGSSLRELPVRRAPVREPSSHGATSAPATAEGGGQSDGWQGDPASGSAHHQPTEQSDGSVIDDMLGYLSTRMGGG